MDALHKSLQHALRMRARTRWPIFELVMLLLVAMVGWAAFQAWHLVREAEDDKRADRGRQQRAYQSQQRSDLSRLLELHAVRDDYLGFERHAQTSMEGMQEALRDYTHTKQSKAWTSFEWSRRALLEWIERVEQRVKNRNVGDLDAWLQKRSAVTTNVADSPNLDVAKLVQEFRQVCGQYLTTASQVQQAMSVVPVPAASITTQTAPRRGDTGTPLRRPESNDPDLQRRREAVDQQMDAAEKLSLQLLEIIDRAHRERTVMQWLIDSQSAAAPLVFESGDLVPLQGRMMPVLYTLWGGLIGLFIFSGVAMYRRFVVAPLHLKLVERETIIEQQEKLAHFEKLAALLAHEIKQPLTAINAWLWTLQKSLTEGTPEHKGAVVIRREMNRVDQIMKDFLRLAQPVDPKFASMQAEPLLRDVIDLMRPRLEAQSVKVRLDSATEARFQADPQQLKQVLLNLVQNAAESMPRGGEVTLRARRDKRHVRGEKMPVVIMEVKDTGPGIPPEVQERLFDPFFSTKENGTGLGLAIAAKIVDKHEGALEFETEAGQGTTFGVVLPVEKK